jgi:hypothetical protein
MPLAGIITHLGTTFDSFLCVWNISEILFQFMKHGTSTLHVAFIFLFSVYICLCLCVSGGCVSNVLNNDALCLDAVYHYLIGTVCCDPMLLYQL